jgi:hypothetical protein
MWGRERHDRRGGVWARLVWLSQLGSLGCLVGSVPLIDAVITFQQTITTMTIAMILKHFDITKFQSRLQ